MSDHAKLSPSAADRWFSCPGSLVLSEGLPERTSDFAEEGTEAHKLAELILKKLPSVSSVEMRNQVKVYTDHVQDLAAAPGAILHVETTVKISEDCWGTADAVVWDPGARILYVRDLKYGAGVGVEVADNLQLKIYATAALLTLNYPAKLVNVGIVQPRYPHSDGPIRSKDYDAVDLLDFYADLDEAILRVGWAAKAKAMKDTSAWQHQHLKPTEKGCRWCLAAPICPKVKNLAQETAKKVFAVATIDNGGVKTYDPEDLAKTLDFLPVMEGWIKNVREFAYAEAEKGHAIPGYKLVNKTPIRKFKAGEEEALAKALGVKKSVLYGPAPLLGVGEIEKLAPGKNAKERAEVIAPFFTKESSGHTLVHESDKREAVSIDAKSAFAEVAETDPFL